jgi:sigma-E factor negative regulatory protein RseB
LVDSHAKPDRFPAFLNRPASDIDAQYRVVHSGVERVAGHACNVLSVEPRDALRYGYKLWADQSTNLLLRAQTIATHGEVLEQVEFTDVSIGNHIDRNSLKPSAQSTDGWQTEQIESVPANFTALGWHLNTELPGFTRTGETKRTFGAGRDVGQMVFSDGLASVSVFIEAVGNPKLAEGEASKGPVNFARRRYGDFWVTVVGEVPASTIHQIAESVQLIPPK